MSHVRLMTDPSRSHHILHKLICDPTPLNEALETVTCLTSLDCITLSVGCAHTKLVSHAVTQPYLVQKNNNNNKLIK